MQASWQARGTRIYGTAELVEREGRFGPGVYMRITPTTSWSWGIEEAIFQGPKFGPRKTIPATG